MLTTERIAVVLSRFTYSAIHMLISTLEVIKKHASIHTKNLHPFNMTHYIHSAKRYELCKKEKKEKISMYKSMRKKGKRESSPYLKVKEKIPAERNASSIQKFHTHAHLDLIV